MKQKIMLTKQTIKCVQKLTEFLFIKRFSSGSFANGLGGRVSIPDRVKPKTQKIVLDAALLSTQHYKVWIKSKVEKSRERSSALPNTSV